MPCLGCLNKNLRLKKKIKNQEKETTDNKEWDTHAIQNIDCNEKQFKKTQKKRSIWQTDVHRHFLKVSSLSIKAPELNNLLGVQFSKWDDFDKKLCLFDIAKSRHKNLELERFFKMYMNRAYFGNRIRSTTINFEMLYDFDDIIRLYQQFSVINMSENKKVSSYHDFRNKLFHTLVYTTPQLNEYKFKNYLPRDRSYTDSKETDFIFGDTRWLKLMSWWKTFNSLVKPSCSKLDKCLRNGKTNLKDKQIVTQLKNDLDIVLRNLNLINSLAEVSILLLYVPIPQKLPNIESWTICCENSLTGIGENFLESVSQDSAWLYFLKECSCYSLNILFSIMKFTIKNGQVLNQTQKIRAFVENCTEKFLFGVIKPYLVSTNNDNNVNELNEITINEVKDYLNEIYAKRDEGECDFEAVVLKTCKILFKLMKLVSKKFQHLFYNSEIVINRKLIFTYLSDTVVTGIIFANRALQNDFLSHNLIEKLSDDDEFTPSTEISIAIPMKFAYIITSCFKIINGPNNVMFTLSCDYIRHDFVSFLHHVHRVSNAIPFVDICPTDFSLQLKVFQEQLSQKLEKSLSNVAKVANIANTLSKVSFS